MLDTNTVVSHLKYLVEFKKNRSDKPNNIVISLLHDLVKSEFIYSLKFILSIKECHLHINLGDFWNFLKLSPFIFARLCLKMLKEHLVHLVLPPNTFYNCIIM